MLQDYKSRQSNLNALGVTELVLMTIATHRAGIEGNLADEGMEVLIELSNAGNKDAQATLFEYINATDRDGRVWNHFKARMAISKEWIVERNSVVTQAFVRMDEGLVKEYANCGQTFRVLQQITEGHNRYNQNLLREQPTHSGNINLVRPRERETPYPLQSKLRTLVRCMPPTPPYKPGEHGQRPAGDAVPQLRVGAVHAARAARARGTNTGLLGRGITGAVRRKPRLHCQPSRNGDCQEYPNGN